MKKDTLTIMNNRKAKSRVEKTAANLFVGCSIISILAVVCITGYMIYAGMPAFFEVGFIEILFGTVYQPSHTTDPQFGILYIILTSIIGVIISVSIAVPIGVLTAINLAELASEKVSMVLKSAIELLAGIPSIVYGMLGYLVLTPLIYKLELLVFKNVEGYQPTGGNNLLAAILVLTIMILPTLINISETALKTVPDDYRKSSLALGASKMQTIFKVVLPSAKYGIASALVLGVGRAIGEAMAIALVAGGVANFPAPFSSVSFLTTAIVKDMKYATGLHQDVLFTIGLVLFVFILVINIGLTKILKRGDNHE